MRIPQTGVTGRPADRLLEREGELAQIEELIGHAVAGGGSTLLLEGAAGIGKTSLLRAACTAAHERGMRVLSASGSELERDFPFGVARQLFDRVANTGGVDGGDLGVMTGAAELARPVFFPAQADASAAGDRAVAVAHGLYWLIANLADRAPLLLCVDDAHWADTASLGFLAYLARRLDGLPVLLAIAARTGEPGVPPAAFAPMADSDSAWVQHPEPLSLAAVTLLLQARLGTTVTAEFAAACHVVSGGNALWVTALLTELVAEGFCGAAAEIDALRELGPTSVSGAVLSRLSRLPPGAARLASALAVLGPAASTRVASELAALSEAEAVALITELTRAQILEDGLPPRFAHPIVRAAIYGELTATERAHRHLEAARALHGAGAPIDAVAGHLLLSEPRGDGRVIEQLREAAALAIARAAPATAVGYLRRACAEPPCAQTRVEVVAELGCAELVVRDPASVEHLEEAYRLRADPAGRAELALLICDAMVISGRFAEAHAWGTQAADALSEEHFELAARLEFLLAGIGVVHPQFASLLDQRVPRLRELADRPERATRHIENALALRASWRDGPRGEAIGWIERGLAFDTLPRDSFETGAVVCVLAIVDELDRADAILELQIGQAQRSGSALDYLGSLAWQAGVAFRRGDLPATEDHAHAALALAPPRELCLPANVASVHLAEALIERGAAHEAVAVIESAQIGPHSGTLHGAQLTYVRGRARLAQGRAAEGIADLRASGEGLEAVRFLNPNYHPWRSMLALALPAGDRDEAHALVAVELERAERVGQPRAIGGALRAGALLAETDTTIEQLRQASLTLERCPSRLERARVLCDLGGALRRAGHRRDARGPLRTALDIAHRCGASVIAQRARTELLSTGARPRRPQLSGADSLTPSERRIAAMAAAGQTNTEIAQALFLSRRTVQMHLTNSYRKLAIDSRTQLQDALASVGK